ncbi:hypothetical protein D9M71_767360 [compost metagenome]
MGQRVGGFSAGSDIGGDFNGQAVAGQCRVMCLGLLLGAALLMVELCLTHLR